VKILITGASGFVGRHLVQSLVEEGHCVSVLARTNPVMISDQSIHCYYQIDLRFPFKIDDVFDFVFHLAAYNITNVGNLNNQTYRDVNVVGTRNLLESVSFRKFVFVSTANLYDLSNRIIDEASAVAPSNSYEESKLSGELLCREKCQSSSLFIFRSVNIVGLGQEKKASIPIFFDSAVKDEPINLFVPLQTPLYYIYIGDVVSLFTKLVRSSYRSGLYNLSYDTPISVAELANKIRLLCKSKSTINYGKEVKAKTYKLSTLVLKKEFRWEAPTDIDTVLREYHRSLAM
jgi:nucleoside-diphosphate-sugar epimerase